MKKIIIVGCGGHAKSVTDAVMSVGQYEIAGFVDKDINNEFECNGYGVIGTDDNLQSIYDSGIHNACIGIGYLGDGTIREKMYATLKQIGYELPAIADVTAAIANGVRLGEGVFIGKNAVVNTDAVIGNVAIVNSGAVIEHDCVVGDFTHIAVGAIVCGGVRIGRATLVGANATVIQGVAIGDGAIVAAGAVVTKNIESKAVVAGIPAHTM